VTHLPADKLTRSESDRRRHTYMPTPDATSQLAYLDVGDLFELLARNWELFKPSLIDRPQWDGRVSELNTIRRRIAHCRRPHADDLNRLEQTLRDLERGAFRAFASFNAQRTPSWDLLDPMVDSWIRNGNHNADFVKHARDQYGVSFMCRYSRRPWAESRLSGTPVSGTVGTFGTPRGCLISPRSS